MASFDLNALSGINAASNGLTAISNNLANSQTVGFKSTRAEFADLFSGSQNSPGNGVRVGAYTQDFGQGTINGTGRDLDFAINGEGFFVLEDKAGKYPNLYTRNGSFKLDKEGLITDQTGNKLQGYLLNQQVSTEKVPVFETTLNSINLDSLNRLPKATDEMSYDINLNGEAAPNLDTNNAGVADPTAIGRANLLRLTNFEDANNAENDGYTGSVDFSISKGIHDSLGGEHRLTANFYKRDVVSQSLSTTDAEGSAVAAGAGVKYTSWIVQYTMQDYNEETDSYNTSAHVGNPVNGSLVNAAGADIATPAPAGTDRVEGQIFELRFSTDGTMLGVFSPNEAFAPVGTAVNNGPLDEGAGAGQWTARGSIASLNWVIDTPFSGANDPLGNGQAVTVDIDVEFSEMTQFAGSNNARGISQNGFQIGDLVGLNTGLDGVIEARYSNGRSIAVARIGLGNFADKNALEKLGAQTYAESFSSGETQLGSPQSNGFGALQAGSLEFSNVDTTKELVEMIQTQRTYQASAQVISTSQTLFQTVLNL